MVAKGLLPMVPIDMVASLLILTSDPDGEVSQTARKALYELPRQTILTAIEGGLDAPAIEAINSIRKEDTVQERITPKEPRPGPVEGIIPPEGVRPTPVEGTHFTPDLTVERKGEATESEWNNVCKKIQGMTVSEKIKLALLGNKQAREVLLKDSNKLVATTVLKNPRITEDEIAKIVNSRNVSNEILREVANNKEWLKKYLIRLGLVNNPRTPIGISLRQLSYLQERDIQHLAKSKNIPSVLASAARKMVMQKERH